MTHVISMGEVAVRAHDGRSNMAVGASGLNIVDFLASREVLNSLGDHQSAITESLLLLLTLLSLQSASILVAELNIIRLGLLAEALAADTIDGATLPNASLASIIAAATLRVR